MTNCRSSISWQAHVSGHVVHHWVGTLQLRRMQQRLVMLNDNKSCKLKASTGLCLMGKDCSAAVLCHGYEC